MPASIADLLTVGGAAVVISIIVEVIKRAAALTSAQVERFGPLLAVVIGILVAGGAAIYQTADLGQALLVGLLAGASSMGISDLLGTASIRTTSGT